MLNKADPRLWYKQLAVIIEPMHIIGGDSLVYSFAAMYDKIGFNRYAEAIRMCNEWLNEENNEEEQDK